MKNVKALIFLLFIQSVSLFGQRKTEKNPINTFTRLISQYEDLPDSTNINTRIIFLHKVDSIGNLFNGKNEEKLVVYRKMIDLYGHLRNKEASMMYNKKLIDTSKDLYADHDTILIKVLTEAGILYGKMGSFPEAIEAFEEGLTLINKDKKLQNNFPIHRNILIEYNKIHFNIGRYSTVDSLMDIVLALDRKLHNEVSLEYAEDLNIKGIVNWLMNKPSETLKYFNTSKEIFEKIDNGTQSPAYLELLADIGNVYAHQNRYKDSRDIMLLRYNTTKSIPGIDTMKLASIQLDYAMSLYGLKEIDEALPQFIAISHILKSTPKSRYSRNNWRCLYYLASCYRLKDETELAEKYMKERISISNEIQHTLNQTDLAKQNLDYGHFLLAMNRFEEARPYLAECLKIEAAHVGKTHIDYIDHARYYNHLEYMDNKDSSKTAYTLFDTNSVILANNIKNASYYLTESQLEHYVRMMDDNMDFMFSILEKNPTIHDTEKALNLLLFTKGFVLNTLQRIKTVAIKDDETSELFTRLQESQSQLSAELSKPERLRKNQDSLYKEVQKLETELTFKAATLKYAIDQVQSEDLKKVLDEDEAIIEFVFYNYKVGLNNIQSSYGALIMRKSSTKPVFVPLFRKSMLDSLVAQSGKSPFEIANTIYGNPAWGKLLWMPLLPYLSDIKHIYVALDRDLHRFNMGAVIIKDKTTMSDLYQITLLNTTRDILLHKSEVLFPNSAQTQRALVIGDIDYDANEVISNHDTTTNQVRGEMDFLWTDSTQRTSQWSKIPYSKDEISCISSKLKKKQFDVQLLTGSNASEDIIKSYNYANKTTKSPELIHFSTHGYFFKPANSSHNSNNPAFKVSDHPLIRSGLLLSGCNAAWSGISLPNQTEDGVLTAWEVSRLNLDHTRLVVLSACETGLGDINNAEGVYGLRRSFKMAGVDKLVMSLWKVPDYQTKELMNAFYGNLMDHQMDVSKALYEAQKSLRKKKYEPYYWAGFVVVE